ncbi:sensor histidine kinase [Spirosoma pulveris]
MIDARTPTERHQACRTHQLFDSLPEAAIERITRLACLLCQTPIARVTRLDQHRQGIKATLGSTTGELPRQVVFCQQVVTAGAPLEVPDTTRDSRFREHPLVTADPAIRFYAGYPLVDPEGYVVGTLCVMDQQPRQLSSQQHQALELLSHTVMDLIVDRRAQQLQEEVLRQTNQALEQQVAERTQALSELHQRFQLAVQGARMGVWSFDLANDELTWNQTLYQLCGLIDTGQPLRLADYERLIHPEDLPAYRARHQQPQQHQALTNRQRIIRPDGQLRWLELHGLRLDNDLGEVIGSVGVVQDITERKAAEDALRTSEERFQEIASHVGEIFWVRDVPSQRFLYVNPAYETMSGLRCADLYADPQDFLRFVVAEDHPLVFDVLQHPQPATQLEFRVHHRDGQVHWLQARIRDVYDESGALLRRIGVATDITGTMEKKELLKESLHKERRLTAHQAHFITTASHMFRTPLTAMSTSVELARRYLDRLPVSPASQPIERHLESIKGKINALDGLIGDTLSLSSVEPGPSLLGWQAIDLVGLSASVIEDQFESYARQGRSVVVEVVGQPVAVAGDERRLASVLGHLLRNAFTYSRDSPRLQLRYGASAVVVQVIDAGIGIPEEDQPYIFDRFFRARNAGDYQGLGLGLAICQEQVRSLGGQLWVESSEGVGTTLSFSLGLRPPEHKPG